MTAYAPYNARMNGAAAHPYSRLTPDVVLDALESVGLRGDGRLLGLNSYENRVYQIYIEEAPPVVANGNLSDCPNTSWGRSKSSGIFPPRSASASSTTMSAPA